MKKALLIFVIAVCFGSLTAQAGSFKTMASGNDVEPAFRAGDKVINLGLGLGNVLYIGRYYKTRIPPVSMSVEYGFIDDFLIEDLTLGLGAYLGASANRYEFLGSGWNYFNVIVGARGAAHYTVIDKLDTYAGLMFGIRMNFSNSFGYSNTETKISPGLAYAAFVGGRYYFSNNLALFGELGYGISFINAGLAFRLP